MSKKKKSKGCFYWYFLKKTIMSDSGHNLHWWSHSQRTLRFIASLETTNSCLKSRRQNGFIGEEGNEPRERRMLIEDIKEAIRKATTITTSLTFHPKPISLSPWMTITPNSAPNAASSAFLLVGGGAIQGEGIKRYKLLGIKQATRIYCTTQETQPIFYNNFKWGIIFKTCESLYCTPVTYNVVHQLYFNFKN